MSHDEIREMNWDSACTSRNLSPAVELADNVKKADSIIQEVHPVPSGSIGAICSIHCTMRITITIL